MDFFYPTPPPAPTDFDLDLGLGPDINHDVQVCIRTARTERVTTSCSECRRRKQKCDQGRPCSNCRKRFPAPVCEYRANARRLPGASMEPAFKVYASRSKAPPATPPYQECTRSCSRPRGWDIDTPGPWFDMHDMYGMSTFQPMEAPPCDIPTEARRILSSGRPIDTDVQTWLQAVSWSASPPAARHVIPTGRPSDGSPLGLATQFATSLQQGTEAHFAPACLTHAVLVRAATAASAAYLCELGLLDRATYGAYQACRLPALHAQGPLLVSLQSAMDEWYFGRADVLQAHLYVVAAHTRPNATEALVPAVLYVSAILSGDCTIVPPTTGRLSISPAPAAATSSPLVAGVPFAQSHHPLLTHATASLLDDVRFLVAAVRSLPRAPATHDLDKMQATARWVSNKAAGLVAGDVLSQTVRRAAVVCTRAILQRRPLAAVVAPDEQAQLWTAAWHVAAYTEPGLAGIVQWLMLVAAVAVGTGGAGGSSGRGAAGRLMQSTLGVCLVQAAVDDWAALQPGLAAALDLHAWLA